MDVHPVADDPTHQPDLIIPGLYLSDLHTAQDPTVATSFGITHIVSVLDFHPSFPHEMRHIKKMHVRLSDNFREKIIPHLDETTAFIQEALKDPESKVLVHCVMGISRSATVVSAYLIARDAMTAPEAIDFIRERRPIICPNIGFRRQLDEYAVKLHGETKRGPVMQVKPSEVPKNIRGVRLWMRGVINKKKEIDSVAS
ncbi:phosphatases II [Thelephora ganbajun]|uniref:Phosphatases II n=1 Tax=Thelephora ganbajun TaxID=370292 RepID=A0ACB6ZBQ5_THEGA|nr:phosphatases II [Thelephora ganbajun]